jgi:hypothetical protein
MRHAGYNVSFLYTTHQKQYEKLVAWTSLAHPFIQIDGMELRLIWPARTSLPFFPSLGGGENDAGMSDGENVHAIL